MTREDIIKSAWLSSGKLQSTGDGYKCLVCNGLGSSPTTIHHSKDCRMSLFMSSIGHCIAQEATLGEDEIDQSAVVKLGASVPHAVRDSLYKAVEAVVFADSRDDKISKCRDLLALCPGLDAKKVVDFAMLDTVEAPQLNGFKLYVLATYAVGKSENRRGCDYLARHLGLAR